MAELSDADKEFIKELREAKENKSLTRREALSVAGGVLGGGVLGAAGTVKTASADASTTDTDGNVGLPGDRVDVFAEGVDSVSIDTDEINTVRNAGNFPDNGADGIQSALNDLPISGGKVFIPPGTYIVDDPGSSGDGILTNGFDGDVVLEGAGESTVLKLQGGATSSYRSILRPTGNVTVRDLVIDGNRANQTDGGANLQQMGVYSNTPGLILQNVTVRDTVYQPLLLQSMDGARILNCRFEGYGMGPHIRETGTTGANVYDIEFISNRLIAGTKASNSFGSGYVIGDKNKGVAITGGYVEVPVSGQQAVRVEQCENVRITGLETRNGYWNILQGKSLNASNCTIEGGKLSITSTQNVTTTGLTVRDPPAEGVLAGNLVNQCRIEGRVMNAGNEGVLIRGAKRGAVVDVDVMGASASSSGTYPAIRIENDDAGEASVDVRVSGFVDGVNNATYAVQAADINQTGLVDNLVARRMVTGTVDNPGGLTVGDTL